MKKYFEVEKILSGQKTRVVLQANSKTDAIRIAKAKNPAIMVTRAVETSAPLGEQLLEFKRSVIKPQIKVEHLIASFRQLAVMTNAGIPIHDSIKEVGKVAADKDLQDIFSKIDEDLNAGLSLTEAAGNFKEELSDVSLSMIELGESTGQMADSLKKLANVLEEINENKRKFLKAIRYPLIVLFVMAVAFTILMVMVVPKFRDIFDSFNAQLPLPTLLLLWTEQAINAYGPFILAAFVIGIFTLKHFYKNKPDFKAKCDKYLLKCFLIGKIMFYSDMNRFFLILTELVKAGIPIVDALDTAIVTLNNTEIKNRLSFVKISVQRGVTLTESFKETGLLEGMLVQILQAGEQSGTLDTMLEKITDYYKSKFDDIIDNISTYIEPILLAFIALLVLWLALGIFLPIWDLRSAVNG